MSFSVTRKTTFGRLGAMQAFMARPSDPFSCASRFIKLAGGKAEATGTRELRNFDPSDEVHEVVDLG